MAEASATNTLANAHGRPLIDVRDLHVHFGPVRAVDGVSFTIRRGETLGLVGESGSGKTTVGRAILRALDVTGGHVGFDLDGQSTDVLALKGESLRAFRKHMQLIFQDPYSSLNPRMTVRDIVAEPLEAGAEKLTKPEIDDRVRDIAKRCRLNLEHLRRFPHAFSGGQRQRICIARALVSNPELIVCDESVSALDVSIQADILNLLMDLQDELHATYLFIAHDLSVVAQISDAVAVMYVGQLMELADTKTLFERPLHPYTKALFSAIPQLDPNESFDPVRLQGDIPNPASPPPGCRFQTRCPFADDRCRSEQPAWREVTKDHHVACHHAESLEQS